jgi:hypothetical protein
MRTLITLLFILGLGNTNSTIALSPQELEEKLITIAQKRQKYIKEYNSRGAKFSVDQDEQIEKELESLEANSLSLSTLRQNGNSQDVLSYDFPKSGEYFDITTSKDKKLRIYSLDVGGGSMRFYRKLVQYQGKSGKVYIIPYSGFGWGDTQDNSFCYDIKQIESKDGPIYLALSNLGSGGGGGRVEQIRVLRIQDDKLDVDARLIKTETGLQNSISFSYDRLSLMDHPERALKGGSVDEQSKSFKIPIVINSDQYVYGEVTGDFLTYRFDGNYFIKLPGSVKKDLSEKK